MIPVRDLKTTITTIKTTTKIIGVGLKNTSRPTHVTHKIFDKNFAAILEIKSVLTLKKTIYVGFTVLELSKWLMYDFHYNFIKNHFDAAFLFTDTDRVTYEIKLEDVYEELFNHKAFP